MSDTRHALAALLPCPFCGNSKGLAVANENPQDLSGGYFIACPSCDASTGLRFACGEDPIPLLIEQWNRRAALSAQPVAGAVATDETGWLIEHSGEILPGAEQRAQVSWLRVQMKFNGYGAREFGFTHDANEALRFARKEDAEAVLAMHLGASPPDWYSKPFRVTEHMWPAAPQPQAAPAPEPSAQAVAHPSHQTVREWMPVSEALRLSDLWTAGDLDNCGQWRAAIKVLADEVRASAPSTPPHAVVEAVPLEWTEELGPMPGTPYNHCAASTPFGRFLITWKGWKENDWPTVDETPWGDFFGSWRTVKEAQAACEAEYAIRLLRGIAPKAAQP